MTRQPTRQPTRELTRELTLGISPCPNDTFMFHDLVHGLVAVPDVSFRTELLDIEALNRAALGALLGDSPGKQPPFDVTKLSLPALSYRLDDYAVLPAGAALGRGCGPLVVCRDESAIATLADLHDRRIAIPGVYTTANLLLETLAPDYAPRLVDELRFDEIMPAVAEGRADAGLIIHESRFTYSEHGLRQVADLGTEWENATGLPLPLGVIAARRSLGADLFTQIGDALRQSVSNAFADPTRSRGWVRQHAQEMDPEVCQAHIDLYVNEFSLDLGQEGRRAIEELLARGRRSGRLVPGRDPWP